MEMSELEKEVAKYLGYPFVDLTGEKQDLIKATVEAIIEAGLKQIEVTPAEVERLGRSI